MDPSAETYQVEVRRESTNQPWGFRLQGGIDFTTPLSIQSVAPGSPAEMHGLKAADAILQINGKATEGMEHDQAKREILMCTDGVSLLVQRGAVQIWRPKVTPVGQMRPGGPGGQPGSPYDQPDPEQYVQKTSLAANKPESYGDVGVQFNTAPRPFQGFGGGGMPAAAPAPQPHHAPTGQQQGGMYEADAGGMQYGGQQQASPSGGGGGYAQPPQYGQPQQSAGGMGGIQQQQQNMQQQPQQQQFAPPQPAAGAPVSGMRSVRAPTFNADHHAKMQEQHLQHHPDCQICGKTILGVFVRIKGHPMHPECFKCIKCGLNLKQQGHFEVEGGLVCERCYS